VKGAFPIQVSSRIEERADWLEWRALKADDGSSSVQDLIQELRRTGTADAVTNPDVPYSAIDHGAETTEATADDTFTEIESRQIACGKNSHAYPFRVGDGFIQLKKDAEKSPYVFLLLLSIYGLRRFKSVPKVEGLFEDVSRFAAHGYFGGTNRGVKSFPFGFPRRLKAAHFPKALDELCTAMGEGSSHLKREIVDNQKDAKLDLVVWKGFADGRQSKLVAFGQCAAGNDWRDKISELNAEAFIRSWIAGDFPVTPLRMFFVPRRIERPRWNVLAMSGGILFDRCRIVQHSNSIDDTTLTAATKWTSRLLESEVRV
jgi:hypothetical protein